jgi:hypothetical protein
MRPFHLHHTNYRHSLFVYKSMYLADQGCRVTPAMEVRPTLALSVILLDLGSPALLNAFIGHNYHDSQWT